MNIFDKLKARMELNMYEDRLLAKGDVVAYDVMIFKNYVIFGAVWENTIRENKLLRIFRRGESYEELSKDEFLKEINKTQVTNFQNLINYCLCYKPIYSRTGQTVQDNGNNELRTIYLTRKGTILQNH